MFRAGVHGCPAVQSSEALSPSDGPADRPTAISSDVWLGHESTPIGAADHSGHAEGARVVVTSGPFGVGAGRATLPWTVGRQWPGPPGFFAGFTPVSAADSS
ncbi:hypothetical protein GCM10014713_31860 [Streptomyces purpureus]|uniref:Uncharacterized protein n=1 Tax=Streptomyces purpureus TaxID=1951 RepID=A0A918H4E4_9ACTN|nr:hypothetical protein GCM10014713_31860 [Streptomyces purpureus]